jgi:glycosyltransferase involved in cell wall biosynthesis
VPVIVPDAGAVTELVNEKNGMIVPKDNFSELSKAMIEMIKTYHQYNHNLIAEEASKKFSYSTIAEKFDQLYNEYC